MKTRSILWSTQEKEWIKGNASPTSASGLTWAKNKATSIVAVGNAYAPLSLDYIWRMVPDPSFPSVRYANYSTKLFHNSESSDYSAQDRPYTVSHMYQAKGWSGTYYPRDGAGDNNNTQVKAWVWAAQDADTDKNIFRHGNAAASYTGEGRDASFGHLAGTDDRYFYIGQWAYGQFWNLFKRGGGYERLDTGEMGDVLSTAWSYAMTGSGVFAQKVGVWLARLAYFMEEPGSTSDTYTAYTWYPAGGYSIDEWFTSAKTGYTGKYSGTITGALDGSFFGSNFGNAGTYRPDGNATQGFRLGTLYDTEFTGQVIQAYELVYDALDDQTMLSFLDSKAMTYSGLCHMRINGVGNYDGNILRRLIEDKVITPLLEQVHERRLTGNIGRAQRAVLDGAIVLDDYNVENLLVNCHVRVGGYSFSTTGSWSTGGSMSVTSSGSPSPLGSGGSFRDSILVTQYNSGTDELFRQVIATGTLYGNFYPRSNGFEARDITLVSGATYFFGGWMRSYPIGTNRTNVDFNTTPTAGNPTAVRAALRVVDDGTETVENYPDLDPDRGPVSPNSQATVTLTGAAWTYFKCATVWPYDYPPPFKKMEAVIWNSVGVDNYLNNPDTGFYLWRPRLWQSGVGLDSPNAHFSFQVTSSGKATDSATRHTIRMPRTRRWVEQYLAKEGAPRSSYGSSEPVSGWFPYYMNNFIFGDGTPAAQGDYQDKDLFNILNSYRSIHRSPVYSGSTSYDPFNNAKFYLGTRIAAWKTILSGTGVNYRTHIGDSGDAGKRGDGGLFVNKEWFCELYGDLQDNLFAQYAHMLNSGVITNSNDLHYAVWHPDAAQAVLDISGVIASVGPKTFPQMEIRPATQGILRNRAGNAAAWFWWGLQPGYDGLGYLPDGERWGDLHSHRDCLQFGLFASGYDMSPDLGYPYDFDANQYNWNMQSLSHNVVLVGTGILASGWVDWPNRSKMLIFGQSDAAQNIQGGKLDTAFESDNVHYIESTAVHAWDNYPSHPAPQYLASGVVKEYRRALCLVDIDEDPTGKDFYLLDIFKVVGGQHHLYSFHGPFNSTATSPTSGNLLSSGIDLSPVLAGTYAGESYTYKSNWLPDPRWAGSLSKDPGFSFIENCQKEYSAASGFYFVWNNVDFWGDYAGKNINAALRMYPSHSFSDVTIGQGFPNTVNDSINYRLDYFLGHNTGGTVANPLASTLMTAFEVTGRGNSVTNSGVKISGVYEMRLTSETDLNGALARAVEVRRYKGKSEWFGTSILPNPLRETKDGKLKWRGRFAAVGTSGTTVLWSALHGGSYLEWNGQVLVSGNLQITSGTITSFTTSTAVEDYREIVTSTPISNSLTGKIIKVNPRPQTDSQNQAYVIDSIVQDGSDYRIRVKDVSFVNAVKNKYNYGAGLFYSMDVGDTFEIMSNRNVSIQDYLMEEGVAMLDEIGFSLNYLVNDTISVSDHILLQGNRLDLFDLISFTDGEVGTLGMFINDGIGGYTEFVDQPFIIAPLDVFWIKETLDLRLSKPGSFLASGISVATALETPGINVAYYTPEDTAAWEKVLITRKTKSYPSSYTDGVVIHSGLRSELGSATFQSFEDHYQMRHNTIYYYSFFTHLADYRTGLLANSAMVYSGSTYPNEWTVSTGGLGWVIKTNKVLSPVPYGSTLRFTVTGTVAQSGFPFLSQTFSGVTAEEAHGVDIYYKNPTAKNLAFGISVSGGLYWDASTDKWYAREKYHTLNASLYNTRYLETVTMPSGVTAWTQFNFILKTSGVHTTGDYHYLYHAQVHTGSKLTDYDSYVTTSGDNILVDADMNNTDSYKFDQYRTIGKAFSGKN